MQRPNGCAPRESSRSSLAASEWARSLFFAESPRCSTGPEKGTLPRYKVRRVVDFIAAHIDQPIRLEHLSAAAAVSPFYFHRSSRSRRA
jgi:AraC-like DNA-binding protein